MNRPPTTATWRPGSWVVPRLGPRMAVSYVVASLVLATSRAWDYITPVNGVEPQPPRPAITPIEAVMPLWAWGVLIAVPTVGLALAVVFRVHSGVWLGLGVLAVIYFALGCGLTFEYLSRPWADGIRSGIPPFFSAYITGSLCLLTRWRPPAWTPSR